MRQTQPNLSDVPIYLKLAEYLVLRDKDRIIKIKGRDYALIGHQLRPVMFPWSY